MVSDRQVLAYICNCSILQPRKNRIFKLKFSNQGLDILIGTGSESVQFSIIIHSDYTNNTVKYSVKSNN